MITANTNFKSNVLLNNHESSPRRSVASSDEAIKLPLVLSTSAQGKRADAKAPSLFSLRPSGGSSKEKHTKVP